MNKVIIGNGYSVQVDTYNYTLLKSVVRTSKETGETYEDEIAVGFFRGLTEALEACFKEMVRDSLQGQDKTLKEAADAVKQAYEDFERCIGETFPEARVHSVSTKPEE